MIQHCSGLATGIAQGFGIPGGWGQQTTQTCGSGCRKPSRRILDGKAGSTVGPTAFEGEQLAVRRWLARSNVIRRHHPIEAGDLLLELFQQSHHRR